MQTIAGNCSLTPADIRKIDGYCYAYVQQKFSGYNPKNETWDRSRIEQIAMTVCEQITDFIRFDTPQIACDAVQYAYEKSYELAICLVDCY